MLFVSIKKARAPGADPGILERGAVRGQSPEPSAESASAGGGSGGPPPENFKNLDAISCNLAYIMGSEWPRISFKTGPLMNKKQ